MILRLCHTVSLGLVGITAAFVLTIEAMHEEHDEDDFQPSFMKAKPIYYYLHEL